MGLAKKIILAICVIVEFFCFDLSCVFSQNASSFDNLELGEEYTKYNKHSSSSSKGKVRNGQEGGQCLANNKLEITKKVLLYLPNRLLDFIDIFRVDLGLGPAAGGVLRISKIGQAGYRDFYPASWRLGLRGRKLPFFIEDSAEYGVSPFFHSSPDRTVTDGEVGLGVDVLIAGVYLGFSFDEFVDFVLGVFTIDPNRDDF